MGKAIDFIKKVSKDLHIEKDERETESEWVTRVAYSASIQSAVASLCDTTDTGECTVSVQAFKNNFKNNLLAFDRIYPLEKWFTKTIYQMTEDVYSILLKTGIMYHKTNRLCSCNYASCQIGNVRFLRGDNPLRLTPMIDAVRITHAHSQVLDELMQTGKVIVSDDKKTWEAMRSAGTDWKTIFHSVNMGHMALLRNLRGVFTEVNDAAFCDEYLAALVAGVEKGKQFPFRYYSAYMAVENSSCNHKGEILDALDACIDISLANMPKLKGKTMCLSDNSGSAWGTIPTEYGSVTVAEIDNLSSVITSACSDEGYVGKFGDKLKVFDTRKKVGILEQAKAISRDHGTDVGMSTEGGIWEFFNNAIRNKEHWDNIFIYSDQQAGTGGLYGTQEQCLAYSKRGFAAGNGCFGSYINVFKLVQEYRKKVNPKVNVFSIQTAGYSNVVIPKYAYRTNLMYGWTGRESVFADAVIKEWDAIEAKQNI